MAATMRSGAPRGQFHRSAARRLSGCGEIQLWLKGMGYHICVASIAQGAAACP
jgi:hypothetical protein